ncbi:MAG: glycosyltransferase [archaeon]
MKLTILSFDSWDVIRSRKHHLAENLAKSNYFSEVIYVAPPNNKKCINSYNHNKLKIHTPIIKSIKSNSPLDKYPFTKDMSNILTLDISHKIGEEETILWLQSPAYAHLLNKLKDKIKIKLIIGDYTDDYSKLIPELSNYFLQGQKIIGDNSNLILSVSEKITDKLKETYPYKRIINLPNAVDESFLNKKSEIPLELSQINSPRVGYVGRIVGRLDKDLIKTLIERFPKYNFVFIGESYEDISWMKKYQNFKFLGPKDYTSLPNYIDNLDVCILPHKINDLTDSNDPVKLYDYLSRGKPVVTTNIEGVNKFSELIYISSTYEGFGNDIIKSLNEKNLKIHYARINVMKNHTWQKRTEVLLKNIRGMLNDK